MQAKCRKNDINNLGKGHYLMPKLTTDRLLKTVYSQGLDLSPNRLLMTIKGKGFLDNGEI